MSSERRNALGKGLSALLNDSVNVQPYNKTKDKDKEASTSAVEVNSLGSVNEIQLAEIEVNPFQPRTDFDPQALDRKSVV